MFSDLKLVLFYFRRSLQSRFILWQFIFCSALTILAMIGSLTAPYFLKMIMSYFSSSEQISLFLVGVAIIYGPLSLFTTLIKDYVAFLASRMIAESFKLAVEDFVDKYMIAEFDALRNYSASQISCALQQAQGSFSVVLYNLFFIIIPTALSLFAGICFVAYFFGLKYGILFFLSFVLQQDFFLDKINKLNQCKKYFNQNNLSFFSLLEEVFAKRTTILFGDGWLLEADRFVRALNKRKNAEIIFFQNSSTIKIMQTLLQAAVISAIMVFAIIELYSQQITMIDFTILAFSLEKFRLRIGEVCRSMQNLLREALRLQSWRKIDSVLQENILNKQQKLFQLRVHDSLKEDNLPTSGLPILTISGVSLTLKQRIIFEEINFSFPNHGLVVIAGPNGSGKSSLLKIILGIMLPSKGDVKLFSQAVSSLTSCERIDFFDYVEQNPRLLTQTLGYNLAYGIPAFDERDIPPMVKEFLGYELINNFGRWTGPDCANLASGHVVKIRIANSILRRSPILILDEPTTSLDLQSRLILCNLLRQESQERCVIVATHDSMMLDLASQSINLAG